MNWITVAYIVLAFGLIAGGIFGFKQEQILPSNQSTSVPTQTVSALPTVTPTPLPTVAPSVAPTPLPASVNLNAPFSSQAPYGKWDEIHEHTCEEASLLIASWYILGKSGQATNGYKNQIPPASAEAEMLAMNSWEEKTFGFSKDTNVDQTARIAKEYLKLKTTVKTNVTEQSLMQDLADGHVIIIPAAGRMLKNPYYSPPGPAYHMLVLTGYTPTHFIADDPGTRHGEDYQYPQALLVNAIHDWLGSDDTIAQGPKKVIVLSK